MASLKYLLSKLNTSIYPIDRYFIIVLPDCNTASESFHVLWTLQIVDVVLLCQKVDGVDIFSYYPYQAGNCNNFEPIVLKLGEVVEWFPEKHKNVNGCNLTTAIHIEAPHFLSPFQGISAEFLKYLSRALNFTMIPWILNDNEVEKSFDKDSMFFYKVWF